MARRPSVIQPSRRLARRALGTAATLLLASARRSGAVQDFGKKASWTARPVPEAIRGRCEAVCGAEQGKSLGWRLASRIQGAIGGGRGGSGDVGEPDAWRQQCGVEVEFSDVGAGARIIGVELDVGLREEGRESLLVYGLNEEVDLEYQVHER